MEAVKEVKTEEKTTDQQIQELGTEYTKLCSQLGDLVYHRRISEKNMNELFEKMKEINMQAFEIKKYTQKVAEVENV